MGRSMRMCARSCATVAAVLTALAGLPIAALSLDAEGSDPNRGELWEDPADLESRDLYNGPWGAANAPDPNATYTFVESKKGGINPGMTVTDPRGREWKVKQPPLTGRNAEGPIEVVLSRVLSAIGYHQPPVYFLPEFTLQARQGVRRAPGGRFRLTVRTLRDSGEWKWRQNPHVGSRPHHGLLVVLLMFNSSDLKDSNNTLYDVFPPTSTTVERWFVVRDLGTALGSTARLAPVRGDPDVFERLRFIKRIENGFVEFDYNGRHQDLVDHRITVADVHWACALLSRLRLEQWHDAFRAGGYSPDVAARFINRLRAKIGEGRALGQPTEK